MIESIKRDLGTGLGRLLSQQEAKYPFAGEFVFWQRKKDSPTFRRPRNR
jgi:hypothetical protein